MKTYTIRIHTIDNLYADYIIEAENLFMAKILARNAFFRDYPGANISIKMELLNPCKEKISEILGFIKEAK